MEVVQASILFGPRAPTVQDVAAAAGVSPMTVSRVLRGGHNVRPEKVQLVLKAVTALGYHRNENARSIRPGQRTGLLGVIITNVANPYYAELQLGIEEIVAADGVRLLVGNSNESSEREHKLVNDFVGRQVDGLIVVPSGNDVSHLRAAQAAGVELVLASRNVVGIETDVVLVADYPGAYEGTRRLIAEGHRRIAYVGNTTTVFTSRRRLEGFRSAHDDAGLEIDSGLIRAGQNHSDAAQMVMNELLELSDPPTAVFGGNNRNTIGVLRAVLKASSNGDPMRIVGFDNFELSDMVPFPLTIIDHDAREMGRTAARMITERIGGDRNVPARQVELPTQILG